MNNILHQIENLLKMGEFNEFSTKSNSLTHWNHFVSLYYPVREQINCLNNSDREQLLTELFSLTEKYETFDSIDLAFIFQMDLFAQLDNPVYTNHILERIYCQTDISLDTKNFLYWQVKVLVFPKSHSLTDNNSSILFWKIYQLLFLKLKSEYPSVDNVHIAVEDRDTDLILVTVGQLLEIEHGPTKTTLDRCSILSRKYHKKIILIETAEFTSGVDGITLIASKTANHKYKEITETIVSYNDIDMPLIQMNIARTLRKKCDVILEIVKAKKPLFILNIGGDSLITDICCDIVPTYTISTIPSGLSITEGSYQMTGHPLTKQETDLLHSLGREPSHVIEGVFTSNIVTSNHYYTRQELGLPTDKFLVMVVGARLTDEVTRDFMEMLLPYVRYNICFCFIGRMDTFDDFVEHIPEFRENCRYLGFINNVVSVARVFDLYLNPQRVGGGTSAVEAMSVGVPVLSFDSGDVFVNVGADFCVNSMDEYCHTLEKYATDKVFYDAQSEKAKQRSEILLDSSKNFGIVLEEFYRRAGIEEKYWYSQEGLPAESFDYMRCYFGYDVNFNIKTNDESKKENYHKQSNTEPVFSIMMAVYNDTSLLNAAINSVLSQDFTSWELLIMDNSDKTSQPWKMLQNAMNFDDRIHAFKSEKNVGWAKSASLLLEKAAGNYVTFLAADDCLNLGALSSIHSAITQENPDVIFVGHGCVNYYTKTDGKKQADLLSELKPEYKVYRREDRSRTIVDIMRHVYYNSMFHYCKVDFLRKNNIDFYDPYYMDNASMTHAMASADSIVVLDSLIYYLTVNTSQTKGYYIWDSYHMFAKQCESIKHIFAEESFYDLNLIYYAYRRIWNNFVGNIGRLCSGRCRNKYMNPIIVNVRDILMQLEDIFSNDSLLEMMILMQENGIDELLDNFSNIILICQEADEKRELDNYLKNTTNLLSGYVTLAINGEKLSLSEKLRNILNFILHKDNYLCIGIPYLIKFTDQCSDTELAEEGSRIQQAIEKYENTIGHLDDTWFAYILE